jgi:peptidoglycan/LPS O-acetylase OafA/YrhL
MDSEPTQAKEIKGLTSLRGIAAIYVVLLHFSASAQACAGKSIPNLAPDGILAVDLFFVLSGFIMAYTYLEDFRTGGTAAYVRFLGRRAARILPLNGVVVLALAILGVFADRVFGFIPFPDVHMETLGRDLPSNLLLLQGLGIGHTMNGPSWSVSDEFVAYLLFPGLLYLAFHRYLAVSIGAVALGVGILGYMAVQQPHLGMYPSHDGVPWNLTRCLVEFTWGLVTYRGYRHWQRSRWIGSDAALLAVGGAIVLIVLTRSGQLLSVLLFPALILTIANNRGRLRSLLASPVLYQLGIISFSVYLIHSPIREFERHVVTLLHPAPLTVTQALVFIVVGTLSILGPAWLTYVTVERPGRRWLRQLVSVARSRSTSGSSELAFRPKSADLKAGGEP